MKHFFKHSSSILSSKNKRTFSKKEAKMSVLMNLYNYHNENGDENEKRIT